MHIRILQASATTPKTMLKILVYEYAGGIFNRDIEKSVHQGINFIMAAERRKAPNYRNSKVQKQRLSECIEDYSISGKKNSMKSEK